MKNTVIPHQETIPIMKVAVWDTYVAKKDGKIMHFDIIVLDTMRERSVIYDFGKDYLNYKNQEGQLLTSEECKFCHIETASQDMLDSIDRQGYFIVEMENCD